MITAFRPNDVTQSLLQREQQEQLSRISGGGEPVRTVQRAGIARCR